MARKMVTTANEISLWIPAEEGMIELRSHRKDGVEEIDRQRVAPYI